MIDLIKNLETLEERIEGIIGTTNDYAICPELNTKWCMTDDNKYINFDRLKEGDMSEYTRFQVSSLAMKQEKLFMGEEDGLFFFMAYEEDGNWDDAELLIFDIKNKVDWEEYEW
jgi:hypothetical protein